MPLKMEVKCSRCGKSDTKDVENVAAAQAFEVLEAKRTARMAEILKFFEEIPAEELPDLMVIGGGDESGSGIVHLNLCDPAEDEGKRSCKKRVKELLAQAAELGPRKPRTKKADKLEAVKPAVASMK